MKPVVPGAVWISLFLGVSIAPLIFATIGVTEASRGFATEFSAALGFVGLSLMGLQFALVARFRSVAAPFGIDALTQFHRQIGLVGLVFVLTHVALSAQWHMVARFGSDGTPWRVRFGVAAVIALVVLVVTSLLRQRLRLSYEAWHLAHAVLAVTLIAAALAHVYLVDYYINSGWKQALWLFMSAAFVTVLVWVRIGKPFIYRRRPWTVTEVAAERGLTTTLTLQPRGHRGISFEPGQFGWFSFDRSPFSLTKHPFSFSSSAETTNTIDISIKALGDFTGTVASLRPGSTVYVDGPHGMFTPDQHEGPGFCLISGGVGITPVISILRTLADRADRRPIVVVFANRDWDGVPFREELDALTRRLDLEVVHVLENPPEGWEGEVGRVTEGTLRRHLPPRSQRWQYFICGPNPMMNAMEASLLTLGVPAERIHTERFGWV